MVWLQSNERFNDLVELDDKSGKWRATTRSEVVPARIDGFYSILSNAFCALFRSGNHLYVRIGNQTVKLAGDVEISVTGPPEHRVLSLKANETRVSHTYALSSVSIDGDVTPFVEDEDFDFGVFLANIASNPERQAILRGEA